MRSSPKRNGVLFCKGIEMGSEKGRSLFTMNDSRMIEDWHWEEGLNALPFFCLF
jgi:hypothetical protein